jgi:uncharacterized oxidoreductase
MPPLPRTPLDMKRIVPLVTGGGSGIGYGLVKEFLKRGSPKVLITGRREHILQEAASKHPDRIFYIVSDVGSAKDRADLLEWTKSSHPECNALVNNAGIQRRIAPSQDESATWEERSAEIEINFGGPVHLCSIFTPYFLSKLTAAAADSSTQDVALLCNVTSGLAFVPFAAGPVYGATKAAMHSYCMSLRYSLEETALRVIEIVPPAVKTNLGGSHDFGEDCDEFCEHVMERIELGGEMEVGYKFSEVGRLADRSTLDGMMETVANMLHVPKY